MNSSPKHESRLRVPRWKARPLPFSIPTALRRFTAQQSVLKVHASNAGEALREIGRRYPQLHAQLFAANNSLRRFINIFVNSRNIRELQQEQTALVDLDTITILPAIAGG